MLKYEQQQDILSNNYCDSQLYFTNIFNCIRIHILFLITTNESDDKIIIVNDELICFSSSFSSSLVLRVKAIAK